MSNFKTLLKYNLINSLGINKLLKKKNGKKRNIGLGAFVSIIYLLLLFVVTLYMIMFTEMFKLADEPRTLFLFIFAVSSLICFFTTISKANVYIFRTKDYDFLMSLPIKPSEIITIKLLSLYIYNLLFVITLIIGADIGYTVSMGFDARFIIASIPAIFLLPLFPMTISSFISFLLGFIPLSQKVKNILSTILYVILFAGFGFIYFSTIMESSNGVVDVYAKLGKYYFMTDWLFNGIIDGNFVKILLFVGVSLVSAILFIAIVSRFFLVINGKMGSNKVKNNYKLSEEKYNSSGDVKTIFLKELRSLINYPSVLIQLLSGPILSIVMVFSISFMVSNQMVNESGELIMSKEALLLIGGGLAIMMLTMVSTTSSTISLEGKSFWILKSAPVKTKDVFKAKILVNILFTIPIAFIDVVILEILIKANALFALLVLAMIVGFVLFSTFLGLIMNVNNPKFDYDNPVKAVKQGKAVLFCVLIDMGVTFGVGGATAIAAVFLGPIVATILALVIAIILSVVTGYVVFTSSIRKYNKLSA